MTTNRRGTSRPGNSYKDPAYGLVEAKIEKELGLPSGLIGLIRTKGERSNADQVSSAGAKTVYQIIPTTRDAFLKKYKVDAYSSPEAAARVAGLHLKESLARNGGNVEAAVGEYHGGTDRNNWGKQNAAYRQRVTGKSLVVPAGRMGGTMLSPDVDVSKLDLLNMGTDQLGSRKPVGPLGKDRPTRADKARAENEALLGTPALPAQGPVSTRPIVSGIQQDAAADAAAQAKRDSVTFGDRFKAAWEDNAVIPAILRSWDAATHDYDKDWNAAAAKNWQEIESFAQTPEELRIIREVGFNSREDYEEAKQRITKQRLRREIKNSTGRGWAFDLGATVLDPVGWVAGGLVGKGVQATRAAGTLAGTALEGALGNLAVEAALDMSGEDKTGQDYAISALAGLGIGAALHPVIGRRGVVDPATRVWAEREAAAASRQAADQRAAAAARIGPDASPEAVSAEVARVQDNEARSLMETSLADVDEGDRFLPADPEKMLTSDPDRAAEITTRHGLAGVSDDAERAIVAEITTRSEAKVAATQIKPEAVQTILSRVGMESTAARLLASQSPVAKAVALTLTEVASGFGGLRGRTAAMSKAVRERLYMRELLEYDDLYRQFRREQGVSAVRDLWDGKVRQQFGKRVYDEIHARQGTPDGQRFDGSEAVNRAADAVERGMTIMGKEQKLVGTVGAVRLPDTGRGYIQHMMDPRKVIKLTNPQKEQVRTILARQLAELNEYAYVKDGERIVKAYDDAFAKKLAAKYLEIAIGKGKGAYPVPMNLATPEAADIVRDALEAVGLAKDDIEKAMGRYSRGGASHTKKRLRLNMAEEIGDGMTLGDLFVTDIPQLYRSYARRVAGEVALAQYGVLGKKGLNEMRKAIEVTGGTADDLKAFDQIAAEFLNMPFGEHNHAYLDNIRTATSLARLGGMGFTQAAEYANGLAAVGYGRTLSAIGSFNRLRKEVGMLKKGGEAKNPILQSIDTLGGPLGMDDFTLTRMFDVRDNDVQLYNTESLGVFSRALRAGGHMQAMASGHRMIVATQTRGMAEQVIHKAVRYIRDGVEDKALLDMGFTPDLRAAIKANMDKIAEFDSSGRLVKLDLLKGSLSPRQMMTMRDAVERGASQIIQRTYIGETGAWAHDGLLKLLFQFRTFSITSVEKQWGRNVNNHGALKSAMYLLGAMSFAAPIYLARAHTYSATMPRKDREEYLDRALNPLQVGRATLNYASASGLLGDILDVGAGFASDFGLVDDSLVPFGARGQGRGGLVGGVIAPGIGLANDLWQGVHGNGERLAKALPGANLPYVAPLVTGLSSD